MEYRVEEIIRAFVAKNARTIEKYIAFIKHTPAIATESLLLRFWRCVTK
jgi:hypothetical protein